MGLFGEEIRETEDEFPKEKQMKSSKKILSIVIAMAVTTGVSFIVGTQVEKYRQIAYEERKEDIATIAIVNMDDGVTRDGEQVNYATQLMLYPGSNFVATGLNDARMGIQNGLYAAYIIIPENFSASVVSIENAPQKIALEYAYNPNLNENAKVQAIFDVNNFKVTLNSNIAYIYVDALLTEFHNIQDDSEKILQNDVKELERLQAVNAEELIVTVPYIELERVEQNIEPIDLAFYEEQNRFLVEEMSSNYTDALQRGKEEYAAIRETDTEIVEASDEFYSMYEKILVETAENQSNLLDAGRTHLENIIIPYNQDISVNTNAMAVQIAEIVEAQRLADEISAQEQLETILNDIYEKNGGTSLDRQTKWEETYSEIQEYVGEKICNMVETAYIQGANDTLDAVEDFLEENAGSTDEFQEWCNSYSEESKEKAGGLVSIFENSLVLTGDEDTLDLPVYEEDAISIDWGSIERPTSQVFGTSGSWNNSGNYKIVLSVGEASGEDAVGKLAETFTELFSMEDDVQEIANIIQSDFVDAIFHENMSQLERYQGSQERLNQEMLNYQNRLMEFDPLAHFNRTNLDSYINDISGNANQMVRVVRSNNAEYVAFAADTYSAAANNMSNLQMALKDASQETSVNVKNCVDLLAAYRETISTQNVSMLMGFINTLTYTRVQSQGKPEVYDHIINPVVTTDNSAVLEIQGKIAKRNRVSLVEIGEIIIGIAILVCVIVLSLDFYRKRLSQAKGNLSEEPEEIF